MTQQLHKHYEHEALDHHLQVRAGQEKLLSSDDFARMEEELKRADDEAKVHWLTFSFCVTWDCLSSYAQ